MISYENNFTGDNKPSLSSEVMASNIVWNKFYDQKNLIPINTLTSDFPQRGYTNNGSGWFIPPDVETVKPILEYAPSSNGEFSLSFSGSCRNLDFMRLAGECEFLVCPGYMTSFKVPSGVNARYLSIQGGWQVVKSEFSISSTAETGISEPSCLIEAQHSILCQLYKYSRGTPDGQLVKVIPIDSIRSKAGKRTYRELIINSVPDIKSATGGISDDDSWTQVPFDADIKSEDIIEIRMIMILRYKMSAFKSWGRVNIDVFAKEPNFFVFMHTILD